MQWHGWKGHWRKGWGWKKERPLPTVLGLSKVRITLVPKSSINLPSKPSFESLFPEPARAPQVSAFADMLFCWLEYWRCNMRTRIPPASSGKRKPFQVIYTTTFCLHHSTDYFQAFFHHRRITKTALEIRSILCNSQSVFWNQRNFSVSTQPHNWWP